MTILNLDIPPRHGKGTSWKSRRDRRRRDEMFKEQRGKCWWCGEPMEQTRLRVTPTGKVKNNPRFASFEHLIERKNGGRSTKTNTVLAHASCNRDRHRRKWAHDPVYGAGTVAPTERQCPSIDSVPPRNCNLLEEGN